MTWMEIKGRLAPAPSIARGAGWEPDGQGLPLGPETVGIMMISRLGRTCHRPVTATSVLGESSSGLDAAASAEAEVIPTIQDGINSPPKLRPPGAHARRAGAVLLRRPAGLLLAPRSASSSWVRGTRPHDYISRHPHSLLAGVGRRPSRRALVHPPHHLAGAG